MSLSDQIVSAESGGDPNATNPNSSAGGAGQFIDSTWLSVLKSHFPDLANGKSDADLIAMKSDPGLSRQMVDAYAADNQAILQKNGLPVTAGNTYLAHFAGPQGAVSVLQADPNAPVSTVLGANVVKSNPFLKDWTTGQLAAWADRKMGGDKGGVAVPPASRPASGILATGQPAAMPGASPGILNAPAQDDTGNQRAFQNQLAQLVASQEQQRQAVPQLAPINFAVPRGISRVKLLSALQSPLGG